MLCNKYVRWPTAVFGVAHIFSLQTYMETLCAAIKWNSFQAKAKLSSLLGVFKERVAELLEENTYKHCMCIRMSIDQSVICITVFIYEFYSFLCFVAGPPWKGDFGLSGSFQLNKG